MKLAILYQYPAFKSTVFYRLLVSESPTPIEIVRPAAADIIIYGPFGRQIKAFGPFVRRRGRQGLVDVRGRQNRPLHVFHTIENMRHNDLYDYSVSYDFSLNSTKDIRFPYWMESIDWSHEGVPREKPLRSDSYIQVDQLMAPLGDGFTHRNGRCAAIFGHMNEPRKHLMQALGGRLTIDGFGRGFDPSIKNSQSSGFCKAQVLKEYSYNLCPENSLYPGYYTEKVLESFASGCLPLAWADVNVIHDFNGDAFINLLNYASQGYAGALDQLNDGGAIERLAQSPLLLEAPSIEPLRAFVRNIVADLK